MSHKTIFICVFLFVTGFIQSQNDNNTYLPENIDSLKAYLKRINSNQIQKINGEFSSKIKKAFKDRDEKVFESVKDSNYVFNPILNKNLDAVLQNIYESNPEVNTTDYRFFIKNSIVPNAACFGDGMFEINLGLFGLLESDDELAFIICHEIAHKLLDHSVKNISSRVQTINSEETKRKIRELKRMKYGQGRAALSFLDDLKIDILDYSKEVEAEADSLGFILFSNTKYNKNQAITSLKKLDYEDDMVFNHKIKIDSVFNFETYPFKDYWLKEATTIFDTTEKINEFQLVSDTLKTHPEIEFRIDKLEREFNLDSSMVSTGTYKHLKELNKITHIAGIHYTIDLKYLDLAIYQLIQKFEAGLITDAYYYETMAEVIKRVFLAKKNHELGKYVPPKNSFSDEKQLNAIRLFIHNLELNEVKKIGLAFYESNKNRVDTNQNFEAVYKFFKNN